MIFRRVIANLRAQHWTAVIIEIFIVIIGVFVGTQVSNWNEERLERSATEKMLAQLVPELRSQIEFFDSSKTYYATARAYADRALAGFDHDPHVSDEQFVIAAYQASQISGISINPDSWSVTFGGDQLRNISNEKVRRNLQLALTADYSAVEFNAVDTPYRQQVRRIIPVGIQDRIREACGDRSVRGKEGAFYVVLPRQCPLTIDPAIAARTAADLRAKSGLVGELRWHIAAIASFLGNMDNLSTPIRELEQQLDAR